MTTKDSEVALLVIQAEKLRKSSWFSFLTGGPRLEEAAEKYQQAANRLKVLKSYQEAGEYAALAAQLYKECKDNFLQCGALAEAANIYARVDKNKAQKLLVEATDLHATQGRFAAAGRLLKTAAEQENNEEKAAMYWKRAADMFESDQFGKSQKSACILRFADISSNQPTKQEEAIQIYETEAEIALQSPLVQFAAREHYLKAFVLRLLNGDSTDASIALDRYGIKDHRFPTSREGSLAKGILEACQAQSTDKLSDAVHQYDSVTPLSSWLVNHLCEIRVKIAKPEDTKEAAKLLESGEVDLC